MIATALSLAFFGILHYTTIPSVSPDGSYYLAPDRPRPYGGRWLLPFVLRQRIALWRWVNGAATLTTALILGPAGPVWLGLASTRTNTCFPVLTDHVGILLVALAVVTGDWRWALLGGMINEKAPVFIALLLGEPWALLGLLGWLPAHIRSRTPDAADPVWLQNPRVAAKARLDDTMSWKVLLAPWGGACIGLLAVPPLAVLVAYAQLLAATDRARLYQWIGPAVCMAAVAMVPPEYYLALLFSMWANPYRKVL